MTLVTVAGTHGAYAERGWFRWRSRWWNRAEELGFKRALADEQYGWCTKLEGVWGNNQTWEDAAVMLARYLEDAGADEPVDLVTHSHGGQVVALALAHDEHPFYVRHLVTLGTPVRRDVRRAYALASLRVESWTHVYAPWDLWQVLGALGDGRWGFVRTMRYASMNLKAPGLKHGDLPSRKAWDEREWWGLLGRKVGNAAAEAA